MFDMRLQGTDDAKYERTVNGKIEIDPVFDLDEGIKQLQEDFDYGRCSKGVLYDYDTGLAISMCKMEVEKDFTNVTLDEYMEMED